MKICKLKTSKENLASRDPAIFHLEVPYFNP